MLSLNNLIKKSPLIIGLAVLIIFILFVGFFDPAPVAPKRREARRQEDIKQIQIRLQVYYRERGIYPLSLTELIPETHPYLTDPYTSLPYEYQQLEQGKDYRLCVNFENKPRRCLTSLDYK